MSKRNLEVVVVSLRSGRCTVRSGTRFRFDALWRNLPVDDSMLVEAVLASRTEHENVGNLSRELRTANDSFRFCRKPCWDEGC